MRPQSLLLVRGAQLLAALTVGTAAYKKSDNTIREIVSREPRKDVAPVRASPDVGTPILTPRSFGLRRSSTGGSAKSTTTIRGLLSQRGLATCFNVSDRTTAASEQQTPYAQYFTVPEFQETIVCESSLTVSEVLNALDESVRHDLSDGIDLKVQSPGKHNFGVREIDVSDKAESNSILQEESVALSTYTPPATAPWHFHQTTLDLFSEISDQLITCDQLHDYEETLQDDLERLFLWGDSFGDGKLDLILESSDDLRIVILGLCGTICEVLLKDLLPLAANTDKIAGQKYATFLDTIRDSNQSLVERTGGKDFEPRERRSVVEATNLLHSSVDCLMRILPTMQVAMEFLGIKL